MKEGNHMLLESIFRGNFTPLDLVVPNDPDYKKLNLEISMQRDHLAARLTRDECTLLDTMIQNIYTAQLMECETYFTFGMSAGLQLQKEAADQLRSRLADDAIR